MPRFTEHHERGVVAFVRCLEHKLRTCENCGFEGSILRSDWRTHVESSPTSGHIVYRLRCPDCNSIERIELAI